MTRTVEVDPWAALIVPDPVDTAPVRVRALTVVLGASGGSGASTLAAGLALADAARGEQVVLAEFELERSDLAAAWGVPVRRTLDDLVPVQAELGTRHVDLVAHRHDSGVALLPGPGRPGADRDWSAPIVTALLACAGELGAVVVDAGSSLGAHIEAAAVDAARVFVVTPPTLAGARRVRAAAGVLGRWVHRERVLLVANRGVGRDHLSTRGFVRACGMPVAKDLPRADHEAGEIASGRWPHGRRSRLARAIDELAGDA